ncbi:FAD-dependent oxidoreductase [Nakamurella flavida]|uniref:FAD-dependent oxidoreductase n=1 Tax=Nakamurella flavida TaxID=363630 RepID=A0A939C479_9ACTN|nr:FAD-dependent oxidoreductase [Nakamurella flavida]MBM9477826.1 FAD-dependent oxidoreductase [Nakamurella flavida]MDP9779380.1 glycine/D-amino acid oxidase-like deaminating enzyme [Nakamurella flavida]
MTPRPFPAGASVSAPPGRRPSAPAAASLRDAQPLCWWLDDVDAPDPRPPLAGTARADLVVVGGGYSGLWTALLAKQADPSRDVVVLEGERLGWAASGRNGGFCTASLTHGQANGMEWYPADMPRLERLGRDNLAGIVRTIEDFAIDCKLERNGEMKIATEPYQVEDLRVDYERMLDFGDDAVLLDRDATRAQVSSPTYRAGLWSKDNTVLVDPARLVWGLADACASLGVRIFEDSHVDTLTPQGPGMLLTTAHGSILADRVALATNAFPPLLKRIRPYVVPVYDYAMVTEPLTAAQLESIGWKDRQGLSDAGNQFHYYRLTEENTILWGGYDVVYHYGSRIDPSLDQRPATFQTLAEHFFQTFPQLEGLRFSHTWGGVIDTCSRFFPFFGSAFGGRVAYAVGYTGLGVGSSRFGAQVMLDLLSGARTELTSMRTIREKPVPFPPEPLRSGVINLTKWSVARADANEGQRNLWLRTLDRFGLGFDS